MIKLPLWLKLLFLSVVIVIFAFTIDFKDFFSTLKTIRLRWIFPLIAISFFLVSISVLKWRLLLSHFRVNETFSRLFKLYLVGYFINLCMPSAAGGDIARSLSLSCKKEISLTSVFLERYTGLVAMIIMGLVAAFFVPALPQPIFFGIIILSLMLGGIVSLFFLPAQKIIRVTSLLPLRLSTFLNKALTTLFEAHRNLSLMAKALGLSFVYQALMVLNVLFAAYALGWNEVSPLLLALVVPIILLIGAIPLSLQGLGIQEGAFVVFLSMIGATNAQALSIALLLRAKTYLLALCGMVYFLRAEKSK